MAAIYGLRRAAEADFEGNAYYQVVNQIDCLIEQLGWGDGRIPVGSGAAYGFASMLAEVRKSVEASSSGNRYYMIAGELDQLASFLAPAANAAPKATAASETRLAAAATNAPVAAPGRGPAHMYGASPTFSELAAASKARVEEMAASLGIAAAHHQAASHREPEPALADGEWERRSSEACAMEELAPIIMEPVAAAALSAEALAVPPLSSATHHMGSPSAQARDSATQGTAAASAPQTAAHPAAEPSASAHDRAADAARQKIESFDELAAASKAQVEHVAATLSVANAGPAERRLESRSSEAGQALETLEPSAIPREIAAKPNAAEAAFYLGSPAPESELSAVEEAVLVEIAAVESTGEQPKRKGRKTLFRLWFSFAFGRKD